MEVSVPQNGCFFILFMMFTSILVYNVFCNQYIQMCKVCTYSHMRPVFYMTWSVHSEIQISYIYLIFIICQIVCYLEYHNKIIHPNSYSSFQNLGMKFHSYNIKPKTETTLWSSELIKKQGVLD